MRVAQYSKMRLRIVFLICMMFYIIIAMRLVFLQIGAHLFFVDLGSRQYHVREIQRPMRGVIYDRNHIPLAMNMSVMSAYITPATLRYSDAVNNFLQEYFPDAYERLQNHKNDHFFYIGRQLSASKAECIRQAQLSDRSLSDIVLVPESTRYYCVPHCGHVVGITTVDHHGSFGLERDYDTHLAGTPTTFALQKDARCAQRYYFDKQCMQQGLHGKPLYTTLDSTVQCIAYEELERSIKQFNAQEGMVIIMDPQSGDIIAMVSYPDFDANDRLNLVMDYTRNKCVSETYEFGSVMKVFMALAALAEGIVQPDTMINCFGATELLWHGMKLTTWKAHGILTFSEVIQYSNNIGTAQVAVQLQERLYEHYLRCGFGKKTGLFPYEETGHVTHPSTWCTQSLASLSYGYEIRATLLQLACAWCMIATGGKKVIPRIVYDPSSVLQTNPVEQLYDPEIIASLRSILAATIKQGTARHADISGYALIGKTGTANLLIDGVYDKKRNIYTFSGAIHHGDYQRVVVTCVKDASSGKLYASTVAAPLFERIVERMLMYDGMVKRSTAEGAMA